MTDRDWAQTNAGRGAVAVLAGSAALALWTLVHAIRIAPIPETASPQFAATGTLSAGAYASTIDVAAAVETDPFAPDRTAPANRYRAPGEESDDDSPKAPPVEPVVLGTAVSDVTHAFATIQLADSHATIMHVGDKIGEYTVKTIERGHVVFTTPSGKKIDITELKP